MISLLPSVRRNAARIPRPGTPAGWMAAFVALVFFTLIPGIPEAAAQTTAAPTSAERQEYVLGGGDMVRIQVFQNPDLTVEARISEAGSISFPLLGAVRIGGLSSAQAERLITTRLRDGRFLQNPQVTLNVLQFRSQQVSVLGNVNRPGRYPLETTGMRLTEVLALAGGISSNGSDTVILVTERSGSRQRREIDVAQLFLGGDPGGDVLIHPGDSLYVHRAPVFYIYGQVQRPGSYPIERGMTLAQAIAKGGGFTLRANEKGARLHRKDASGTVQQIEPRLDDAIRADDLIYVRESLF